MPPQMKSRTIPTDMPRAMYCVTLKSSPTDMTKVSTSNDMRKVVMKLVAM